MTTSSTPSSSANSHSSSSLLASKHLEHAEQQRQEDIHKNAKTEDPFAKTSKGLVDILLERKAQIGVALGVLILAGAGLTALKAQRDAKLEKGRTALYQARKKFAEEMKNLEGPAPAAGAPAAKAPDFETFDVATKLPGSLSAFESVAKEFEGTLPGFEAIMAVGGLYFDHGNPQKALEAFEKAEKTAPTARDKGFAALNVAYALENTQQHEVAIQAYQRALQGNDAAYASDASFGLARSEIALGKGDRALEIYDSLISKNPNTDISRKAQTLKSLVK